MQDPPEPRAVCRRHPCSSESYRLRRRGTLARGAARTGWPVCICAASTSGAVRRWWRRGKAPAYVGWSSSWWWHRLRAGAGALERSGSCLPRRTASARFWWQRCGGGASAWLGCTLDPPEPRAVCWRYPFLDEPLDCAGAACFPRLTSDQPACLYRRGFGAGCCSKTTAT